MIGNLHMTAISPKFHFAYMGESDLVDKASRIKKYAQTGTLTYTTTPTPVAAYVGDSWVNRSGVGNFIGFNRKMINWACGTIEAIGNTSANSSPGSIVMANSTGGNGTVGTGRLMEYHMFASSYHVPNVWDVNGTAISNTYFNSGFQDREYYLVSWKLNSDGSHYVVFKTYTINLDDSLTLQGQNSGVAGVGLPAFNLMTGAYSVALWTSFNGFDDWLVPINMYKISPHYTETPSGKSLHPNVG